MYSNHFMCSSTDSQLKLWNVNKTHCLRSFKGHINEKNFVGLASNGDYVACGENWLSFAGLFSLYCKKCSSVQDIKNTSMKIKHHFLFVCVCAGSENNSLYLYYKGLSKTLLTFKFDTVKSVLDKDKKEDDTNEFVSAVCWRALPDGVSSPHCYYTLFGAIQRILHHSVCSPGKQTISRHLSIWVLL